MFNLADIIVLAIIILSAFIGYKRGAVKTIFKIISFFVALALAFMLYKPVAVYLTENTSINKWIINTIEGKNNEGTLVEDDEENEIIQDEASKEFTFQNLPENLKEIIGIEEIKDQAITTVSHKIAAVAINIISLIGIYIVVKILLVIVSHILDGIMKVPILKQINEVLGLILGTLLGILQIYILFMIITFLASFMDLSTILVPIKESLIARILYESNIIIGFLF